jgi:glycosyltransferase involved in cell wall biosynthesis
MPNNKKKKAVKSVLVEAKQPEAVRVPTLELDARYKELEILQSKIQNLLQEQKGSVTEQGPIPKIVMCMIVKNEEETLIRTLDSACSIIDSVCIVDTGSTDRTVAIAEEYVAKKFPDGKVFQREWVNFGVNRTEALSLAMGMGTHALMIDSGDVMSIANPALAKSLVGDADNVKIFVVHGVVTHGRPHIFKLDGLWRYLGCVHEYADRIGGGLGKMVQMPMHVMHIKVTDRVVPGGRNSAEIMNDRSGRLKFVKDAEIILNSMSPTDPDSRDMFYLAQSYRDAGMEKESVEWYTKRYNLVNSWYEERYMSALELCRMLNSYDWAWAATEVVPERHEALVHYIMFCRLCPDHANALPLKSQKLLAMAKHVANTKKPDTPQLFMRADFYDWRGLDESAIVAYYAGNKKLSKRWCKRLLDSKLAPESQLPRIKENLRLCNV